MPRRRRSGMGGLLFHVLNRGVRRSVLFDGERGYAEFETLLARAHERVPLRLIDFCLMPTHFHLILWPHTDKELSEFMRWLTVTHVQRVHARRGTAGTGALYQGRFKAFPVQRDEHFLRVCRYVHRNPVRAGLCKAAEEWRWSSLWHRYQDCSAMPLDPWPIPQPHDWIEFVNQASTSKELAAVRAAVRKGTPYGQKDWVHGTASQLDLGHTLRKRGRPRGSAIAMPRDQPAAALGGPR